MKTIFLRALEAEDKAAALRGAIHQSAGAHSARRFELDAAAFATIPRSPFVYWIPPSIRQLFVDCPNVASGDRSAKHGGATLDDFRFLRLWTEVTTARLGETWRPFLKGGAILGFWTDVTLAAKWRDDGHEIKAYVSAVRDRNGWGPQWSAVLNGYEFYGQPGITWSARPHLRGYFAHVPRGCIFSHTGMMLFVPRAEHWATLAALNSSSFVALLHLLMARGTSGGQTLKYESGYVGAAPLPAMVDSEEPKLVALCHRAWAVRRSLETRYETSHAFTLPALLQVSGSSVSLRAAAWRTHVSSIEKELAAIQAEIDERCFEAYGILEADRRLIVDGFVGGGDGSDELADADTDVDEDTDEDAEDDGNPETNADESGLVAELVSWAVGVAIGHFDVRLATRARALPNEPEPFEPLPACSPAMLTGADGLPLMSPPTGYPLSFPETGILVDDQGNAHDLQILVREVFDAVFKSDADVWMNEVGANLDPKEHRLGPWLASKFFEYHLKRYSKSRRKAPLLWQLSVPSGRYSVWLYAHRLTRDSFFQIQNDVVTPKLAHEERQLIGLVESVGANPSAKERKEIAEQEALVGELRSLLDNVKRVAPLWNPMLDDGVVLTMAPLWRLVPQHKPWQRELKSKWDGLAAGKYDWSHVAMHLWPERVVQKCATDRSLAIAHGFEDVFWVEDADGKWKARPSPLRAADEIVRERASIAVQAALKSLLDAPVASATGSRARRRAEADA
jgi:hypothetical protein